MMTQEEDQDRYVFKQSISEQREDYIITRPSPEWDGISERGEGPA